MALEQAPHNVIFIVEKNSFLEFSEGQPLGQDIMRNRSKSCHVDFDFDKSTSRPTELNQSDIEVDELTDVDSCFEGPGEVEYGNVDMSSLKTASNRSYMHPESTVLWPCPPCPGGDFNSSILSLCSEPSEMIHSMSLGSDQYAILAHSWAAQLELQATQLKMMAASTETNGTSASPMMLPVGEVKSIFADYTSLPNVTQSERNMAQLHQVSKSKSSEKERMKSKKVKDSSLAGKDTASPRMEGDRTTLMLRNIPNNYTREMLVELLDAEGFRETYDFVYLPMDFHRMAGLGYAFVNLISGDWAEKLKDHFQGFTSWKLASQKLCEVSWGEPLQGKKAHIERFRNHPVMHADVPEKYKPIVFDHGARVPFPPPTKAVKAPRMKKIKIATSSDDGEGVDDNYSTLERLKERKEPNYALPIAVF